MSAIITITFSPCIDKSTMVPGLYPERKLLCTAPVLEPGGGGINVARAIGKLGGDAIAVFPSGGYTGKFFNHLLEKENIPCVIIETGNETRENIIVFDTSSGNQYRFGMPGTELSEMEWKACLNAVKQIKDAAFIIASGSLPPGVPPSIYGTLARIARANHAKFIVDASGEGLKYAVDEGVYLLKPNLTELASLSGTKTLNRQHAADIAKKLVLTKNCEIIVVSLGAEGALLVTRQETIRVSAPAVEVKSTVGAGDSMVAGIVYSLHKGENLRQALQFGVACGTAATLNAGTELCGRKDAYLLADIIRRQDVLNTPLQDI